MRPLLSHPFRMALASALCLIGLAAMFIPAPAQGQTGRARPGAISGVQKRIQEKETDAAAKKAAVRTEKKHGKPGTPDLSFVPSSAHVAVVVQPQLLMQSPQFARAPYELLTALGLQEIGLDPVKLQQLTILANFEEPGVQSFAVLFQSTEPLVAIDIAKHLHERQQRGFNSRFSLFKDGLGFLQWSPDAIVLGAGPVFEDVARRRKTEVSQLYKRLKSSGAGNVISIVMDLEPMSEQLPAVEALMADIRAPFRDLKLIPQLLTAVEMHGTLTKKSEWKLILDAKDEAASLRLDAILKHAISEGIKSLETAPDHEALSPLQAAQEDYSRRMFKQSLESLEFRRTDQRIVFSGGTSVGSDLASTSIGLAVILPAVQASRESARRAVSKLNMKHIALAMFIYHDIYGKLPADIMSADGKPLLSWRVAILPYIEERALYEQFKLDEPWDSKHNLPLLEQMPDILRSPHVLDGSNNTLYLRVIGAGTAFENGKSLTLDDVTDGHGNTIAVVEANLDKAVPWTQPADLAVDLEAPLADLGKLRSDVFLALFLDASCHPVPTRINPETIKHLFTIKGGETLPLFIQ